MPTDNSYEKLDGEIVEYIQTVQKAMQLVLQAGAARFGVAAQGEVNLAGLWYEDVPMLSRAAADALGLAGGLFTGAPCDSQQLRGLEEQVRITGEFVAFLEATLKQARGLYNAGRKNLCDWTYGITDQIIGLEGLPFLTPEQRALVESVAPLIHKVLDARTDAKNATRDNNLALKAEADARTAQAMAALQDKEREIALIRSSALPAPAAPTPVTAPRTVRRPRRTRRT